MKLSKNARGSRLDAVDHSAKEGLVGQEEDQEKAPDARVFPSIPLKGGSELEIVEASSITRHLRRLLEKSPDHFNALAAIIDGEPIDNYKTYIRDLKYAFYLKSDGSVFPGVAAVMKAALRFVDGGPCIVDPFDPKTPEDMAALMEHDARAQANWDKFALRIWRQARDQNKGRPLD